jgi:tripartite-type tricarboxylate transporter receptor subunit TctC
VLQTALPLLQGGKMHMLAVMGPQRVAQFPDVPTLAQVGVPNVVSEAWFGVTAPVGTPPAVIAKMNSEINSLLALPEVKEAMAKAGVEPIGGKPEKLDAMVRSEIKMWTQVVKKGNITAD